MRNGWVGSIELALGMDQVRGTWSSMVMPIVMVAWSMATGTACTAEDFMYFV